ncbi:jupiter microtubule associated homolog 1-like isoform X2 [Liolophura sinensis]|uniref:jupiter microtubule associated homolog 1-like isoform X2 n=1 Tax=Liolophura sinensis TaxID=3198878 RepID=UPI0031585FBB
MTTTDIPLGIEEGKPSSRVLRPPGGGSSFSLGGADPAPLPQKPRQSASDASPATETSSPAVTKATPTPDNTKPDGKAASFKPVENSHSRIFGDAGPATGSPSRGRDLSKGASAFNPITGEVYPGFEHIVTDIDSILFGRSPSRGASPVTGQQTKTPEQPSTKVRQPPGGFSHGIF